MSAITPTTFETTFTRADVREHLRKKCASNYLKKMTNEEKDGLYNRAPKTVNAEGDQVSPRPQAEFKNSEWISEIIGSWDRVEAYHIPVSVMETIVMKPEAIDSLNQKFEAKETERAEKLLAAQAKKLEKKEAKKTEKLEKKEANQAEKLEKKMSKLREKLEAIDSNAILNNDGLVVVTDDCGETVTMSIKDYAKQFKSKQTQEAKNAEKQAKIQAKIDAASEKLLAKEAAKQSKIEAKEADKAAKKEAKEAAKEDKKRRNAIIKDTVKYITDSDKRILITDNSDWLSMNGIAATSVEEFLAIITTKEYKKLLLECDGELEKMSWYQQNHGNNNE
jgi:predicted ribosome quality control (RQC) complex YloA/Tae2 family protein